MKTIDRSKKKKNGRPSLLLFSIFRSSHPSVSSPLSFLTPLPRTRPAYSTRRSPFFFFFPSPIQMAKKGAQRQLAANQARLRLLTGIYAAGLVR